MTILLQHGLGGRGQRASTPQGEPLLHHGGLLSSSPSIELGVVRPGPERQRRWDCFQFEVCLGYGERNSPPNTNKRLSPLSSRIFGEFLLHMLRGGRAEHPGAHSSALDNSQSGFPTPRHTPESCRDQLQHSAPRDPPGTNLARILSTCPTEHRP